MPQYLLPRVRDLGGFSVKRLLPHATRRSVGPFVFFDHIGPADIAPGEGMDVRPHPHIGLATLTYLWEGAVMHRDSVGSVQEIIPGDVNWMTAGRGIVHSERTPERLRNQASRIHGLQTWLALPREFEEVAPAFAHHPKSTLPLLRENDGAVITVVAGTWSGVASPVAVFSDTLYAAVTLSPGGSIALPPEHEERALYCVDGSVEVDADVVPAGALVVFEPYGTPLLRSPTGATFMLLGGAPLDAPRTLWWNFVHSDPARIARAKEDWQAGRFERVPGETEFIPLPEG